MPSSLLNLATLAMIAAPAVATNYDLLYKFDQTNFFQNFSFNSDPDPTHGFVQYLDYQAAHDAGLAKIDSGNVYLGVDHTNTYTSGGRPSTRVESNIEFDQGLLIADIAHMPGNACGVWPAFWTTGSNWPQDGEIDIIEGINQQATTQLALHTQEKCDISTPTSQQSGQLIATSCSTSNGAGGCTVKGTEGSYGDDFNALGGGVYAMEVTAQAIKVWFFPRASIPESITSGHPDTATFGTPMAAFQGSCDFESGFKNQKIIINTDFCGDWAGYSYGSSSCASKADAASSSTAHASCEAYVGANPSAFVEAYWEIVSIDLYKQGNDPAPSGSSSVIATSTARASSVPVSIPTGSVSPSRSPVRSSPSVSPSNHPVAPSSSSGAVPPSARVSAATSSCSSTSTVTVTSLVPPSTGAQVAPTTSPCSSTTSTSTLTVTSFASTAPQVQAVSTASSKLTTTTVIVTSYVDVCPTGYTTKTITQTVTYCPADATSSSIAPVFTTTSKLCTTGCAPSPTTVVVVVPVETSTTGTSLGSGSNPASAVETATLPAKAAGTSLGSGSNPASAVETATLPAGASLGSGTSPASAVETATLPAKAAGTSLGSGSNPASAVESATIPTLPASAPATSKTGISTAVSPVRTPIYSTGGLVPAAPSSAIVPPAAKPSSPAPGGGSVTSTSVKPALGAGSRMAPSAVGFLAAVAGFVLFI